MPVKSLYSGAARKVARLLCPLLCPYVDGHAGESRGGIGSERAALGYNAISRDVRCKGVVAGRCRTLNHFRSHPKKFLTRPFQFPRSDNHVTVSAGAPLLAVLDAPAAMLMTKAHRMAILAYLFKEVRASTARLADGLAPGGRHGPL